METEDFLQDFFVKRFEMCINQKMLQYSYVFQLNEVLQYIQSLNSIPVVSFLELSYKFGEDVQVTAGDIFQFSNFSSATVKICEVIKARNNPGVSLYSAGRLLLQDDIERKKEAYIKYGENQLKTAEIIGLLFELTHTYFLSCLGYVINDLDETSRNRLLLRCLLRCKLISKLFSATQNGNVNLRQFLFMLSDSTYRRRLSNLLHLFRIMNSFGEFDFSPFFSKILH